MGHQTDPGLEARLAARYAPIQLNGLPLWMESLVDAHPEAVDAVHRERVELGTEVGSPWSPMGYAIATSEHPLRIGAGRPAVYSPTSRMVERWRIYRGWHEPTSPGRPNGFGG